VGRRLRRFATGGRVPLTGHPCPAAEWARSLALTRADARALSVRPSPSHTGPKIKRWSWAKSWIPAFAGMTSLS